MVFFFAGMVGQSLETEQWYFIITGTVSLLSCLCFCLSAWLSYYVVFVCLFCLFVGLYGLFVCNHH